MSFRIGGPFNFGQIPQPVVLAAGGIYYPPPGNYLLSTGNVTVLQYFDPILQAWRIVGQPNMDAIPIETDGSNWRFVNLSGVVIGASITNAGSGAVNGIGAAATGVAVSFGAAPNPGWAPAAVPIVGGAISGLTIANAGSGFTVAPLILIDPPPPGGIQATATASINPSTGVISAVALVNAGAGYTSTPNVYVVPQSAVYGATPLGLVNNPVNSPFYGLQPSGLVGATTGGASITANGTTGSGTLTGLVVTNYGSGYAGTTIPTITITGAGAAAATAIMSMSLTALTITNGGVAFGAAPIWETSLGLITNFNNNNDALPRASRGVTTLSGGVINTIVIEDPGFGFQKTPVAGTVMTGGTPATTEATLTPVVGGITDTSFLQPAVT